MADGKNAELGSDVEAELRISLDERQPGLRRLEAVMAVVRDPALGCPWDLRQDFATIAPHTLEEAYEVVDAIERGDQDGLPEELGDLLLQVAYYAQLGRERGLFDLEGVAQRIVAKMIARHPHVFGEGGVQSEVAVKTAWEARKAAARAKAAEAAGRAPSAVDDVPTALPALSRARKLQKRAAGVGFDWPDAGGAMAKLAEEIDELGRAQSTGDGGDSAGNGRDEVVADELSDVLFAAVNVARKYDLDAETVLRRGNAKFEERFRAMEARLRASGQTPETASLDDMEAAWQAAKRDHGGTTGDR